MQTINTNESYIFVIKEYTSKVVFNQHVFGKYNKNIGKGWLIFVCQNYNLFCGFAKFPAGPINTIQVAVSEWHNPYLISLSNLYLVLTSGN